LDQEKCEYVPHVVLVPAGGKLTIGNGDPILHTVHAYNFRSRSATGLQTLFNMALPVKGMRIPKTLDHSGVLLNLCDTGHPWMSSYVIAMEHPYFAVTGPDGKYLLERVPPGAYTLKVWHEPIIDVDQTTSSAHYVSSKELEATRTATVTAGKVATLDFEIGALEVVVQGVHTR
jgi:hypothetical protein